MTKASQRAACAKRKLKVSYMLGVKAGHLGNCCLYDYNLEERACIWQYRNSYEIGKKHANKKIVSASYKRLCIFLISAIISATVASVV